LKAEAIRPRRGTGCTYGEVCPAGGGADLAGGRGSGYDFAAGSCATPVGVAELSFDLSSWSGRAVIGKRLGAFGVAAGGGYEHVGSTVDFDLGANVMIPLLGEQPLYLRATGLRLEQGRWSAFANGWFAVGRARLVAEAGWLQGGSAVAGFDAAASAFDPARGAWFGSVGVRTTGRRFPDHASGHARRAGGEITVDRVSENLRTPRRG
jgi:hypothetical protein